MLAKLSTETLDKAFVELSIFNDGGSFTACFFHLSTNRSSRASKGPLGAFEAFHLARFPHQGRVAGVDYRENMLEATERIHSI